MVVAELDGCERVAETVVEPAFSEIDEAARARVTPGARIHRGSSGSRFRAHRPGHGRAAA